MKFTVVIPARYASTRLPGKALVDIAGKPMIQWVHEKAMRSGAEKVIIATDDEKIATVARGFGAEVCMTGSHHQSGTERLAEVVEKYALTDDEIIVNVQGDEPLIPPRIIRQVAENLAKNKVKIATLAQYIDSADDIFNPNVVKVVTDKNGYALYFSRAPIPWDRVHFQKTPPEIHQDLKRHIGLYAYRAGFIKTYIHWAPSPMEQIELLEQLRVLWHGEKMHVEVALEAPGPGVDTFDDLVALRKCLEEDSSFI